MRILHGPANISGMAGLMSIAQRRLDHAALSVTNWSPNYRFFSDLYLDSADEENTEKVVDAKEFRKNRLQDFDIYHYYFGTSYEGLGLGDFVKLAKKGKQVFMTFCGCDVRDSKQTQQTYGESVCRRCWPTACSPNRELAIRIAQKYARQVFVSTVDLLDVIPDAIWLPQPVDLSLLPSHQIQLKNDMNFTASSPLRIIHAPSDLGKKGTDYLFAAVDELQAEGHAIELDLLTGVSQKEVYARAAKCHIAVDQLTSGTYGSFAVEMMAIGLPTLCFMRPSWMSRFSSRPPIVNVTKTDITASLRAIVTGQIRLKSISTASQNFVLGNHSADAVAAKLETYYIRKNQTRQQNPTSESAPLTAVVE